MLCLFFISMNNCSACASMEMWQWSLTLCCANIVVIAEVRDVLEVVVAAAAVAVVVVDRVAAVVG